MLRCCSATGTALRHGGVRLLANRVAASAAATALIGGVAARGLRTSPPPSTPPPSLPLESAVVAKKPPSKPRLQRKAPLVLVRVLRPRRINGNIRNQTTAAVARLKELYSDPANPRLLKVGTRKKGCSGQTYSLEYVTTQPSKLDEIVEQDGVRVLIDSKALFSLIGSEMDYQQDELSSSFVFNNPNVKEMCGCGESFMV
ncbi:hypothetical protein BC830DRAFT_1067792 [Chytriomyces sp. MP71]|nr:hypothetical protein BC830DRAFT_1067792 [Chytriomyces sp. MP71]